MSLACLSLIIVFLAWSTLDAHAGGGSRVVYDQFHGESLLATQLISIGERLGFDVVPLDIQTSSDVLRNARLLVVRAPTQAFDAEEKRAIVDHVRAGGTLLLVLDEECRQSLTGTGVNDLITPFGLTLTADTEYLHNCGAIAKAGVINAADRELPYSGGRAVEGGTPFAWRLDAHGRPAEPFAAHTEVAGGGRVVVLAEAMASLFMGTPEGVRLAGVPRDPSRTTYWGKNSAAFMAEIYAWLLRRGA
jgi:hypothetical protein